MRIRRSIGNVEIRLNTDRLDRNVKEAQKVLNIAVRDDCEPLVPHLNNGLRDSFRFGNDSVYSGFVEWDSPYAHYQYVGEIYGPNIPIRDEDGNITGWWSPENKHPTGRKMKNYSEPGTGPEWFEEAKKKHGEKWIRLVKDEIGKG